MASMLMVFAAFERRRIGTRIREALAAKREREGWQPRAPRRVPDEVRARVVELNRSGLSTGKIAERLNEDGVPSLGQHWRRETVRHLLVQEGVAC